MANIALCALLPIYLLTLCRPPSIHLQHTINLNPKYNQLLAECFSHLYSNESFSILTRRLPSLIHHESHNRLPINFTAETSMAPAENPDRVLFEVRTSEGKGRGLFATQDIARGSLIMLETPVISLKRPNGPGKPYLAKQVQQAFKKLTPQEKDLFLSLSDRGHQHITDKKLRIYMTNTLGDFDPQLSNVCLQLSLINHSCVPNSTWQQRAETRQYMVTAIHPIAKNEEITITYTGYASQYTAAQGQEIFKHYWNFTCDCKACTVGTPFNLASDLRRTMLGALWTMTAYKGDINAKTRMPPNCRIAHRGSEGKSLYDSNVASVARFTESGLDLHVLPHGEVARSGGPCGQQLGGCV
jgi:hypothetical protein